jgi:hypothetical protein
MKTSFLAHYCTEGRRNVTQIIILSLLIILTILAIILLVVAKMLFSRNIKTTQCNFKILNWIKFNFSVSYFNE